MTGAHCSHFKKNTHRILTYPQYDLRRFKLAGTITFLVYRRHFKVKFRNAVDLLIPQVDYKQIPHTYKATVSNLFTDVTNKILDTLWLRRSENLIRLVHMVINNSNKVFAEGKEQGNHNQEWN